MIRAALVVSGGLVGGCGLMFVPVMATAVVAPPVIGGTALPIGVKPTGHATITGLTAEGAPGHEGGWGASVDTSSIGTGYLAHGKIELGRWGRDQLYGFSGAEAGVGVGGGGYGGGLMIGYGYGGFTQNGHTVPVKAMAQGHLGPVSLRLSGYVGWRFGVKDEFPAAASRWGAGWNAFGAELSTIVLLRGVNGSGGGLAATLGIDRQDDVNIGWLKLGLGVAIAE